MNAQHTPGRLRYDYEPGFCGELRHDNGTTMCAFVDEPNEANARRLVACWNACDGLRTESLERMGTLDRATIAHEVAAQSRIKLLEGQRDELLTAIGACRDAMPETAVRVNDAIADPLAVPDYVRESVSLLVSQREELLAALKLAEAALSDIGDADREPGDDVAWCEARAAKPLPEIRAAIAKSEGGGA